MHILLYVQTLFDVVDNGGGMDPDRVRQCMSLGYSVKSKSANTIGQCKSPCFDKKISI